jgi:hypothetical protein
MLKQIKDLVKAIYTLSADGQLVVDYGLSPYVHPGASYLYHLETATRFLRAGDLRKARLELERARHHLRGYKELKEKELGEI